MQKLNNLKTIGSLLRPFRFSFFAAFAFGVAGVSAILTDSASAAHFMVETSPYTAHDGEGGALFAVLNPNGGGYTLAVKNVGNTKIAIDSIVYSNGTRLYWPTTYQTINPAGGYASGSNQVYTTGSNSDVVYITWHSLH